MNPNNAAYLKRIQELKHALWLMLESFDAKDEYQRSVVAKATAALENKKPEPKK